MVELFTNSGDPDQTSHSAVSDLGLHCLPTCTKILTKILVESRGILGDIDMEFQYSM